MDKLTRMREKAFEILDPNSDYDYDSFLKEFGEEMLFPKREDFKIGLKFVNKSNNPNPKYATNGSSGFDLAANLEGDLILKVGERKMIPTGLFFEIPENFEIQIRPRSGLAAKNGVTVLNTPGTIDADYRGEVKVILINLGEVPFTVSNGDRIAQGIIGSVFNKNIVSLTQVDEISEDTERLSGGFGSTGVK